MFCERNKPELGWYGSASKTRKGVEVIRLWVWTPSPNPTSVRPSQELTVSGCSFTPFREEGEASVLVTLLTPWQRDLQARRVYLGSQFEVQALLMGNAWWQEPCWSHGICSWECDMNAGSWPPSSFLGAVLNPSWNCATHISDESLHLNEYNLDHSYRHTQEPVFRMTSEPAKLIVFTSIVP